jgi:menaquinone-9 beta-reductase
VVNDGPTFTIADLEAGRSTDGLGHPAADRTTLALHPETRSADNLDRWASDSTKGRLTQKGTERWRLHSWRATSRSTSLCRPLSMWSNRRIVRALSGPKRWASDGGQFTVDRWAGEGLRLIVLPIGPQAKGGDLLSATDVFVVGGGPAGLAAALAARQRGLEVTVADSCSPPIDKPCGEGLMPDGVAALGRLGVSFPPLNAHAFRGIRFVSSGLRAEARFHDGPAFGVRRTQLHRVMIEHAERAGVRFLWHSVVTGLDPDGVLVRGELARARWIIGADGGDSRVRRWAGLDVHRQSERRFAFRRHYRVAPWTDLMELHWGARCQLYLTPVGSEEVCVALLSGDPGLRLDEALRQFPEVAERLQSAEHTSLERGAVSVTRRLARVCSERVALIGDASGSVDAITGEGLCLAFRQADLLGDYLLSGDLARYQSGHRALVRRPTLMARALLLLEARDGLRRRLMRVFANEPRLFARLLATHVGAGSAMGAAANGLALGWRLLTT